MPSSKRGFCSKHYTEWYRQDDPDRYLKSEQLGRVRRGEYFREYYLANKQRIRKASAARYKRYKAERPEKLRESQRRAWAKNKYGLTLDEYEEILSRGCAICGTHEKLCIDHDHTTGKVRDALCAGCNRGLGDFHDDATRLRVAAEYLETHKPEGGDA